MSEKLNEGAAAAYIIVAIAGGVVGFVSGAVSAYFYWVRLGGRLPL